MTLYDDMNMLPNRHLSVIDEDDDVYDNYIETTIDPGDTLFIIAIFICIGSLVGLPLLVKLIDSKCLTKKKHVDDTANNSEEEHHEEDGAMVSFGGDHDHPSQTDVSNLLFIQRCRKLSHSALMFVLDNVVRWRKRGTHHAENMDWRREAVARGIAKEAQESMKIHQQNAHVDDDMAGAIETSLRATAPGQNYNNQTQIPGSPEYMKGNNQLDIYDQESCTPAPTRLCSYDYLRKSLLFMWTIVKYDNESMRLLRLAVPFTFSAIAYTVAELFILAIISRYLGTDAMIAYAMVDVIVGISASFMGGWVEAISSLGSMAYGASNYELVGQYVQTACIGYFLCEIPMAFIWGFSIGKIILLMGFDEDVAVLAESFVWVKCAINVMTGLNECVLDFLEVTEKEKYANIMFCLSSGAKVGLVALFAIMTDASLVILGLAILVNEALFFFLNILIPNKMGWLHRFEVGLFGKFSFRDRTVLNELFKVALPLAFGSLLAYAEWEILTIFAAVLGPAEAATWAILGFVWDVFESTTEAIGDASEVRCAYQLGKGRPALAKLSAYKSMFLASMLTVLVTTVFLSLSGVLPSWLTHDITIQGMLVELFPLIALGNITMNMGMVCWALVGAQGRYRLATSIATACSLLITVPIGAIVTVWLRINLQGLTFAVVIGYTVTSMLLSTVILTSDWEKLSKAIVDQMAAEEDSDSDDDSSSSSSDSSSDTQDHDAHYQKSKSFPGYLDIPPTTPGGRAGYHEIAPTSPGGVAPPPPIISPPTPERKQSLRISKLSTKYQNGPPHRSESLPYIPRTSSPPRSPTNYHRHVSRSTPRSPTRRPRPTSGLTTPDRKQGKSLAMLRDLGSQHSGHTLPKFPDSPSTPGSPITPGSPVNHAYSPAGSYPPNYIDGEKTSPSRVVKGRRRRFH